MQPWDIQGGANTVNRGFKGGLNGVFKLVINPGCELPMQPGILIDMATMHAFWGEA